MLNGVLFICLGNSCRSIMAEALARHFLPDAVNVGSAGLNPLGYITEETLLVLAEAGVATEGLRSKGLDEINLSLFPLLVNLTAYVLEGYLPGGFRGRILHHPVVDPFGSGLQVYRESRDAIRRFVTEDLPQHLRNF